MFIEDQTVKKAWKDVIIVAKFFLSCLGLCGTSCVLAYNLNIIDIDFPNFAGRKPK